MLTAGDFEVSDAELQQLNAWLKEASANYGEAEAEPGDGIAITFYFSPTGRELVVQFAGGPAKSIR